MVTIKDIADQANVTPSTVSRVLNQSGGYSEKTKRLVESIASKLNYQRNEAARNLVSKSTNIIGVIVTNATTGFAAPIIDSLEDWAYQHGERILLAHCGLNDHQRLTACLNLMAGQKVSGIISISVQFDDYNVSLLEQLNIPLISIGVKVPNQATINIDNQQAALVGTQYLISRGYRNIALVGVDVNDPQTGQDRIKGYQMAIKEAGLSELIVPGDYSFNAGKRAANQLLTQNNIVDAIFAASDDAAAGVIYEAQSLGIEVPTQLSVLGFDNSKIAEMVYPGITTIDQPFAEMGEKAIEYLSKPVKDSINLKYQIKIRGSVADGLC